MTNNTKLNECRGHIPKLAFKNGKAYCKTCGESLEKTKQDICQHLNNRLMLNNPDFTICTDCWYWWDTKHSKCSTEENHE